MSLFPHIALDEGTRITELASKLGVSKQAVGQLVDDLEAMGIVQRAADPADGRAKRVHFTAAGRQSMLDGLTHLRQIERRLARSIGKDVMQALHDALLVLGDHLDQGVEG
ncbi:MAG: MarR family transcriptional regulator [bacterium]|nr:MarR family transcriptional regulator [bacterium]